MRLRKSEEEQQFDGIPTRERLDHFETGESYYCPRPFSKVPQKEREIPNRWTEYCSELYNHKASGDPSEPNCFQTVTEDDYPSLRNEVEVAVLSVKKKKSAGVDNIPAELVQAGGEDVIITITTICNKIWQTGEWPTRGPSPQPPHFLRKATCSSARTTERAA